MEKFVNDNAFFDQAKRKKKNLSKSKSSILNRVGGRKGLLLASIILDNPKYKDLI